MPSGLSADALADVAEFIAADYARRKSDRADLEEQWEEIDRQVGMTPVSRETRGGDSKDWFPDIELPLQHNALEVIAADARRLKFPAGSEWYSVLSNLSDEYLNRWDQRRTKFPIIGAEPGPMKLNQETADALVKAILDHYHQLYDFRSAIDLFDAECIKYGTGVVRVRPVELAAFRYDYRGVENRNIVGPAVIPCSIKTTYLEDGIALMHEGLRLAPTTIRYSEQLLEEVKRAAKVGGPEKGWMSRIVGDIDPQKYCDDRGYIERLELEGDLIVPRSRSSLFMPNMTVTVMRGAGGPKVIRIQENELPARSYVVGHYMRHDPLSAYGVSPLMKGAPLQEGATEAANQLIAVAALQGKPPISWDGHDSKLQALGGPQVFPGAMWDSDSPDSIIVHKIGDMPGLMNVYLALVKQFEDTTGVNDPRRGAQVKSHTSATSHMVEAERGLARTDDFVQAQMKGPMTSILNMEWDIAKQVLKRELPIPVNAAGIRGYVNLGAKDLPDDVVFEVMGAEGTTEQQNKSQLFVGATNLVLQLLGPALQMAQMQAGKPLVIDFEKLAHEIYQRAGVQDTSAFIGASSIAPPAIAGQPGVPPTVGGVPTVANPGVQAGQGGGAGPRPGMGLPVGNGGGGASPNGLSRGAIQ